MQLPIMFDLVDIENEVVYSCVAHSWDEVEQAKALLKAQWEARHRWGLRIRVTKLW